MARHANSPCIYRDLATAEGYCCVYHYTIALAHAPAAAMGRALGIDENTIHYWRNKVRRGQLPRCQQCPTDIKEHSAVVKWKTLKTLNDCIEGR